MEYRFSVGSLELKIGSSSVKIIEFAKDITIDYKINTHKEYGPEGQVIDEEVETEDLTITAEFIEPAWDTNIDIGVYYDLVLSPGPANSGLSITLANCRVTGYNIKSTQGEFVTSSLTFSKKGKVDDAPGSTVDKQVIKFGEVYLGDSATLDISYDGNISTHIIPTALGIITRATEYMGGGQLNIQARAYVKKETRIELEAYIISLYSLLDPGENTLTVTYGGSSYTVPKCVWAKGGNIGTAAKFGNFTLEFIKSAY
jgi:hypothetical protein